MSDASRAKFEAAVEECRLHADILGQARQGLPASFAAAEVASIDGATRRLLDQAADRFMQLQDSLGALRLTAAAVH